MTASIIMCVLMIAMGGFSIYKSVSKNKRCSVRVPGTVIGRDRRVTRTRRSRRTRYYPVMAYSVDGEVFKSTAKKGTAFSSKYKDGSVRDIRYNPDFPEEFVFADRSFLAENWLAVLMIILGALFIYWIL